MSSRIRTGFTHMLHKILEEFYEVLLLFIWTGWLQHNQQVHYTNKFLLKKKPLRKISMGGRKVLIAQTATHNDANWPHLREVIDPIVFFPFIDTTLRFLNSFNTFPYINFNDFRFSEDRVKFVDWNILAHVGINLNNVWWKETNLFTFIQNVWHTEEQEYLFYLVTSQYIF